MNFTAPTGAVLVKRQEIPLAQLGEDFQPIALWVLNPGKEDARTITLRWRLHRRPDPSGRGSSKARRTARKTER